MENSNYFPFGKYLLIVEKTKEEDGKKSKYKILEKDKYGEAFEAIKKHILEKGKTFPSNWSILPVEDKDKYFSFIPKDENSGRSEDILVWTWDQRFIIEVVSSLDDIDRRSLYPKLLFVFNGNENPYYLRLKAWTPVLETDATKEEIMYIKEFEKALGVVYDSSRWKSSR